MCKPTITMTVKNEKGMAYVKNLLEISKDKSQGSFAKIICNVERDNKKVKIELPENTVCNLSKISPKNYKKNRLRLRLLWLE